MGFFDILLSIISSKWFAAAIVALAVAFLICLLYIKLKRRSLGMLGYSLAFSSESSCVGNTFELTEELRNETLFPLFAVSIEFYAPGGLTVDGVDCDDIRKLTSISFVPPRSCLRKIHSVTANKRGQFRVSGASALWRKDIFDFDSACEICVYPAPAESFTRDVTARNGGEVLARRSFIEDRSKFAGLRAYEYGDAMGRINFKASSRSFKRGVRVPMSNIYDSTRGMDSMIFLNFDVPSELYATAEKLRLGMEAGISIAFSVFCTTLREGGRVGFACNVSSGEKSFFGVGCDSGKAHISDLLSTFSNLDCFGRVSSFEALLGKFAPATPPDADIYIVTPCSDPGLAKAIGLLENGGRNVIPLIYGGAV